MNLLKKENWWIWLVLMLLSDPVALVVLAATLNLFNKNEWYSKWKLWVIGIILIVPFPIMAIVFILQILTRIASKLNIAGSSYYSSPFIWIILFIVPIIGWLGFVALYLYLIISILISMYNGEGEKYILNN